MPSIRMRTYGHTVPQLDENSDISTMSRGPDTELHSLIASLSQSERRYVKQDLRRHVIGTVNQSELLFDAIASQSTYDEGEIKRRFHAHGFVRRLPEAKRELLAAMLRAMWQFHTGRTAHRQAIAAYLDGLFLGSKGAQRLAERRMHDAVQTSQLTENHALRSLMNHGLISTQRTVGQGVEPTSPYMDDPGVVQALHALEVAKMQALLDRLQAAVQRYGQTSNPAARSIASELVEQGRALLPLTTVAARQTWLRLQSLHRFFFAADPLGSLEFDRERLSVFEESEPYRRANLSTWLSLLHSVALRLASMGRVADALPYRDTLREHWSSKSSEITSGIRHSTLGQYLNLEVFLATQTLEMASDLRQQIIQLLREHETPHHSEIGIAAWFNLALVDVAEGRYSRAIKVLNEVDAYPEDLREDTHRAASYLRVLCHTELEHDSVVTSMVRRLRRSLKGAQVSPDEDVFLSCMASYLNTSPGTQRSRLLRSTLEHLRAAATDTSQTSPIGMFAFEAWLRSKLERRTWRELVVLSE